MMTDPKSGDYLAWFFGTNEQTRGQMAYFLKLGCPVALRPQPNEKDDPRPFVDFEAPPDFVRSCGSKTARKGKDIVELIKRARTRTDRTHAVLHRNSGDAKRLVTATRNPLEIFVVGIGHHFNNLFMTIQGNVSLILGATVGEHRHDRRFRRIERLVLSESMLTNDLLGIVIEKGCYIDGQLQAHLLDEIIAISDTAAMRQAFCGIEGPSRLAAGQSRRALRRFADSLVFILQRLLGEIREHTAFIIADDSADEAENARLYKIMKTVDRGQKLLSELRHYSGSSGPFVKRIGAETLAEVVRVTCLGRREDIRCHLNIDPNLVDVEMDGGWLYTILRRLYDNSAEAMPKGGDLFVEVKNHQGCPHRQQEKIGNGKPHIRLKFRDTGQGIAPEILTRIFDPFYTTKPSKIHSGLGLAVVDGLLQTTGGRIRVDSKPGQGATFTLDLPAAEISSGLLNTTPVQAHEAQENVL
ncbi:MAG: HAMP domain-containing sensor histidine kinase [Desulfobacterales bacterium]